MSREAIADELRRQGAILQTSVTSKTDLVIALNNPSAAKLAKAEKLGIPVITIEQVKQACGHQPG